jgi:hypothetical protein
MVAIIIIPLIVTGTIGILGYLTYRLVIFDYWCNRAVNKTLQKYNIKKTQFQIIKEYYENKGEPVSDKVIDQLAKQYRQKEPEQFLAMYDSLRDKSNTG